MRSNTHRTAAGVAATAVVAALTLGVASPAGAVSVADEASLRAAVGNPAEPPVTLTADNDLVDCAAGDLERVSATDLVIEGYGFTMEQTCPGERVLAVGGGGSLTVDHTRLTGGTPALNGGGAMRVLGHAEVRA